MNSQQLRNILNSDEHTSMLNPSVKSLDEFVNTEIFIPSMNIVNFDQSHQPGSHWIAVNITDSGSTEYFDSYGDTVQNILIDTKLKQMGRIKRSKHVLQGISTVCGQYCLIFLLMRARNYSYKNILSKLKQVDSSRERDFIVSQVINDLYFGNILKKKVEVFDKNMLYNENQ